MRHKVAGTNSQESFLLQPITHAAGKFFFLISDVVLNIVIKENMTGCGSPYAAPFQDYKMLIQSLFVLSKEQPEGSQRNQ